MPGTPSRKAKEKDTLLPVISMSKVTIVKKQRERMSKHGGNHHSSENIFEDISAKGITAHSPNHFKDKNFTKAPLPKISSPKLTSKFDDQRCRTAELNDSVSPHH